ncbi:MAG: tRNA 2-thiouridine(34) synthase MnmA [Gammaproteobacteria bacterium]|nr:MAG: tRNA 2-thiouridine(34) synthase MnmA [Gammaproteobacteria bacterium]
MARREIIVVGISGGVDSAVAALRLLQSGFDVQGLHMTNWEDGDAYCTAADDFQAARRVCAEIGIPLHRANFSAAYREQVFATFLAGYQAGSTPNPDVLCNRHIKFGVFLDYARRLGATRIATGHYARIDTRDPVRLLKAADPGKDQTYFLHAVPGGALRHALFPLGDLTKREVRAIAAEAGLPNHQRPDSTGICFIGERPFREFLGSYLHAAPGPIVDPAGRELGRHQGLAFYTLGQRCGLGIGGRAGGAGEPWYVAAKRPTEGSLVVVQGRMHPMLWSAEMTTGRASWIDAMPPGFSSPEGWRGHVRLRHRHEPGAATVRAAGDGSLIVHFEQPQWAITPGQYAVFYDGDICLGGAVIASAGVRPAAEARVA